MTANKQTSTFGRFLKFWRSVHNLSQEELAFRLECSPRHISRLENGSSRPSEAIVLDIGKVLNLGKRDLNHLLIAAGFAQIEESLSFDAPELKWLRKAMTLTLRSLDPYPACVSDSSANILMVNRGWVGFYSHILTDEELNSVSNLFDIIFDRYGAGAALHNSEETLSAILMSIQQNALFTDKQSDLKTVERLRSSPLVPQDWRQRAAQYEPMASFRVQIQFEGALHKFFSVSTSVGALGPTAFASEPKLNIATLYPEDEQLDLSSIVNPELTHPLLFY